MTARRMKPDSQIVSRCFDPANVSKLRQAGANQVVSPFELSGNRITQAALHPTMVEFVDFLEDVADESIEMADIVVKPSSKLVGQKLSSPFVSDLGIIIVGIKTSSSGFIFDPKGDTIINAGDHLVIVGPKEKVERSADQGQ